MTPIKNGLITALTAVHLQGCSVLQTPEIVEETQIKRPNLSDFFNTPTQYGLLKKITPTGAGPTLVVSDNMFVCTWPAFDFEDGVGQCYLGPDLDESTGFNVNISAETKEAIVRDLVRQRDLPLSI